MIIETAERVIGTLRVTAVLPWQDHPAVLRIFADPEAAAAEGVEIKSSDTTGVWRLQDFEGDDFHLKRFAPPRGGGLRDILRRPASTRALEGARLLLEADLPTAPPVAAARGRGVRAGGPDWWLTRTVPAAEWPAVFETHADDPVRREAFLTRTGRLVARVSRAGLVHGDLKGRNLLAAGDSLWLIDTDAVRVARPMQPADLADMLGRLAAYLPADRVTDDDRRVLAAGLDEDAGDPERIRRLADAVETDLRRRREG